MEINNQLETLLSQINDRLPPKDRIGAKEIAEVGQQLSGLIADATDQAGDQFKADPPRTLREKLLLLWQAIRAKINQWLAPMQPQWKSFLDGMRTRVRQIQDMPGNEKIISLGLIVAAIVIMAAMVKSWPLLVIILATLGFITLIRLADRATRFI